MRDPQTGWPPNPSTWGSPAPAEPAERHTELPEGGGARRLPRPTHIGRPLTDLLTLREKLGITVPDE